MEESHDDKTTLKNDEDRSLYFLININVFNREKKYLMKMKRGSIF